MSMKNIINPRTRTKWRIAYLRFMIFLIGFNSNLARKGQNYDAVMKLEAAQRMFESELERVRRNQRSVAMADQFMKRVTDKALPFGRRYRSGGYVENRDGRK